MGVKHIALLSGLPLVAAGVLVSAIPAEAAIFVGPGQLDISSERFGNAFYTQNAIDFTVGNPGPNNSPPSPSSPGEVEVTGQGGLSSLSGRAQIFDLFSPTPFPTGVKVNVSETTLLRFADGTTYNFTAFTRTGQDTGPNIFEFEGAFVNAGDRTPTNFAFITGQLPVAISSTTVLGSLDQIDDPGVVVGNASYSGTFTIPAQVPEPTGVVGLLGIALGAGSLLKRKKTFKQMK
ncbi:MAG: PEP-CTERM sorting domain-containing protein [Hydrococcus sp. C42_A2020_068]|nr:PEP-CTERM sorting domain-containing protein [Hydrococcus sp. C42_A2020_068]